MLGELLQYFRQQSLGGLGRDLLDLLITYYVFYRVALVLKGTRAMQVGVGLALVFLVYVLAQLLHLQTVLTLLQAVLSSAILIGVVVFQSDIRRGLMRMGSRARFGTSQTLEGKVIDAVIEAATSLARHRIGAIITFEQEANLDEFVGSHTGHVIDAAVSAELLVALFVPEGVNQMHDGAVIIRDLRIAKAGVFFPMPEGKVTDESFGSRHRAAMGITEETDAVVVIVSEERGSISFCFNGNIIPNLDGDRLRIALEGVFAPKKLTKKRGMRTLFGFGAPESRTEVAEAIRQTIVPLTVAIEPTSMPPSAPAPHASVSTMQDLSAGTAVTRDTVVDRDSRVPPGTTEGAAQAPHTAAVKTESTATDRESLPPAEEPASVRPSEPVLVPLRKLVAADSTAEAKRKSVAEADPVPPAKNKKQADPLHTPLRHLTTKPKEAEAQKLEHKPHPVTQPGKLDDKRPAIDDATTAENRRLMPRAEAEPGEVVDGEAP